MLIGAYDLMSCPNWGSRRELAAWSDPGAGGFYDNLGELGAAALHYVLTPGDNGDQSFTGAPLVDRQAPTDQYFQLPPDAYNSGKSGKSLSPPALPADVRKSQLTFVSSKNPIHAAVPIMLRYTGLRVGGRYNVTAAITDDFMFTANGAQMCKKERGGQVAHSDSKFKMWTCRGVTADKAGNLELVWRSSTDVAGGLKYQGGAGVSIAEVWLRLSA